ncbi:MAG: 16S rRNA (cytidine(1402)-2'-O)-methyltransferase [Bacteroidota bacterium]|jgi:16S rRNA (cytidine1402-2'-O)-methyltransferase|nr:16S rRNA (cytidine(1402)-2'-O)-methyltransferase [Chitinophagaceae bacterium]
MLYIVPTPIGNLADMTFRAVAVLKEVDLILAEDTRTSGVLLKHYEISKPLQSYHQHNEHQVTERLVAQMQEGKSMALLTDAGTPGISDPAFFIIRACIKADIRVECLPGATALIPALVNSGLPSDSFCFEGFLPLKKGRHTLLSALANENRTIILYESPMRLVKTLHQLMEYFGEDRPCCVSRELTKKFEENARGTLKEVHDHFKQKTVKGEIVVVIAGKEYMP